MRPFSLLERKIIEKIIDCDKVSDIIYIHNVLSDSSIFEGKYEVEFYGYEENAQRDIAYIVTMRSKGEFLELNKVIGTLISLSYFIDYLVDNGFLVKEKTSDLTGPRFINKIKERHNLSEYRIESELVSKKFATNLQYKFYATELLRDLVKNGYESFEKKEMKTTRRIAIIGLVVAFASFIVPLVRDSPVEIDTKSIDYFYNKQNNVAIDSGINSGINSIDTIQSCCY